MIQVCSSGPPGGFRRGAFTLIEIIIAMTIIAVIAAIAVPTLKGLHNEEQARAPLVALAELVQEVRTRVRHERRPYQIIFEREGVHAIPGNRSFAKRDEFLKFLEELRTPPEITSFEREQPVITEPSAGLPAAPAGAGARSPKAQPGEPSAGRPPPPELPWTGSLSLDKGLTCEVLMWGDGEWEVIEGDRLRRWVFQITGMANPGRVRFLNGPTQLEAGFDILTGEMTGEQSRPRPVLK